MKLFHALIPNLAISLNIALLIVIYLDMRNPMMGFLVGAPFQVLVGACCLTSVITAITLYGSYRRKQKEKQSVFQQKISE